MKYFNYSARSDTRTCREDRGCCEDAYPVCFTIVWIPLTLMKVMAGDFLSSIDDVAGRQHFFDRNLATTEKPALL